ncbi:MAG: exo-alpha-sialidase [Actinobacteria bacterium]|nr:MAG: exo-alpha-sialidase [Actinomycetota bacterium]
MARTVLLVGTRKGCFLLESPDRRDWTLRGPFCEGWPVYHAIHDPGSGAIYAAAASEWHGSAVWRSPDLGETWTHSSEGLAYDEEAGRKLSKVSTLAADNGRLLVGVEAPGIFESRDQGATWSLLSTLAGQPGSEEWDDPANQPPGHLGISALMFDRDDSARFWAIVQGIGVFETADDGKSWTPRNRGLRADWPRPHEEVGFCVHKLVRSPSDRARMFQQNHVGMHRSDDEGHSWTEITEGLPTEFGFAAAVHPHDRDTFYVIPLDPGHGRTMVDGHAAVWRTSDGGSSWQQLDRGLPQRDAYVGVLREAMAIDRDDDPGLYFGTSTGQIFASVDAGDNWMQIADFLPSISSVEVATIE